MTVNESLIAGSVSGGVCRVITLPLDVLKVRLQLQTEPVSRHSHSSKYNGFHHAARTIWKEEGLRAFWKGLVPGELLYIMYGATQRELPYSTLTGESIFYHSITQFTVYEASRNSLQRLVSADKIHSHHSKTAVSFVSGCMAGATATILAFPFDVLKTRMIGQGEPKVYPNLYRAILMMYGENGLATFYKGLTPALLSIVPQSGIYFTVYNLLSSLWKSFNLSESGSGSVRTLSAGAVAGVISKTIVLPFDLIKKRLEVQGFEIARSQFGQVQSYNGVIHCFWSILKQEGWAGFYKGTLPTIFKAALSVSVSFTVYEKVLQLLHERNNHIDK